VRLCDVWFRYARRGDWTLRAVNAAVEPGQTVVVLGRNGAGKSTLLQIAAGVLRPVRGAVRDRPAVVGWVPERFPADQPFTAGQYLRRMAALRGRPAAGSGVDAWMERLQLTEHRDTRMTDLSKGTAQKVGLAQALLVPPGLLVLDEPWEGLDAVTRALIPEIVGEVTAAGGLVLISDHGAATGAWAYGRHGEPGTLRGEVTGLPGAIRWTVAENTVHHEDAEVPDEVVVEIAVRAADADDTVARLRADGHRVLGVRAEQRR
jgi:ABC-2 type transport system ATP-binding protein